MTGKYMGKAALCPPTINEMNMSQNSVVLRTESPLHSAFLTIFLNSDINRMQVKGTYSITKQKFINQGKISSLHVIPYSEKYKPLMEQYISFIDNYYQAIGSIRNIINKFNQDFGLVLNKKSFYDFIVPSQDLSKTILTAHNYRPDAKCTIAKIVRGNGQTLNEFSLAKGDEIGSANYSETGIPFVKTSDIINFDVDHEPNCYCSPIFINQLQQDIKAGDIVFTKDGKVGEIAIIQEDANIVISSGLVKCRASNELERYFIFLLLSSNYGLSLFEKWFVIASTMTHLRKNFYSDFVVPELTDDIINKFIIPLKTAFELKESSYQGIMRIKEKVIASYTDESIV